MIKRAINKLTFTLLFSFLFLTCIERNNPWDPINGCPEEIKAEYRKETSIIIDSIYRKFDTLKQKIDSVEINTSDINGEVIEVLTKNRDIRDTNSARNLQNDSIQVFNSSVSCDQVVLKKYLDSLQTISVHAVDSIENIITKFRFDSIAVISTIADVNKNCTPAGIYSNTQVDSILERFSGFTSKCDTLILHHQKDSIYFLKENDSIKVYNSALYNANLEIVKYNDSILYIRQTCQKGEITDSDSAKNKIKSIRAGDTLYLSNGVFKLDQITIKDIGDTATTVIMGSPLMNTFIDASELYLSNCSNFEFKNLIFQNSPQSGIKLENSSAGIFFLNCIFQNNEDHGIEIAQGSLRLENCIIRNNGLHGIKADQGQMTTQLNGTNLLIVRNGGHGVFSNLVAINFTKVTISDNDSDGVYLKDPRSASMFNHCIISYNGSTGIYRDKTVYPNGIADFIQCDFYGNLKDIDIDSDYVRTNHEPLYVEPGFVDRENNNYRIMQSSTLYEKSIGFQYLRNF